MAKSKPISEEDLIRIVNEQGLGTDHPFETEINIYDWRQKEQLEPGSVGITKTAKGNYMTYIVDDMGSLYDCSVHNSREAANGMALKRYQELREQEPNKQPGPLQFTKFTQDARKRLERQDNLLRGAREWSAMHPGMKPSKPKSEEAQVAYQYECPVMLNRNSVFELDTYDGHDLALTIMGHEWGLVHFESDKPLTNQELHKMYLYVSEQAGTDVFKERDTFGFRLTGQRLEACLENDHKQDLVLKEEDLKFADEFNDHMIDFSEEDLDFLKDTKSLDFRIE